MVSQKITDRFQLALKSWQGGLPAEAQVICAEILEAAPDHFDAMHLLGLIAFRSGDPQRAVELIGGAIKLCPGNPTFHTHLGLALQQAARPADAIASYERALAIKPHEAKIHLNLSGAFFDLGQLDEAEAGCRRALALAPGSAKTHHHLGRILRDKNRVDEAKASLEQAIALEPTYAAAHGSLIFISDLVTSSDTASLQSLRKRWDDLFAAPALRNAHFPNTRDPDRALRIGYVSADFREHSAPIVFGAMLVEFNADEFEVFAYSNSTKADRITALFRRSVTAWRTIAGQPDDAVADMIREDGIDILVDLSGHSAGNRLGVFAMKPAPIQITAWGFNTGTGMKAMDVILLDPILAPEDEKRHYAEEVRYLPNAMSAAFYGYTFPEPGRLPALSAKGVTFGAFNRLIKVSDEAFRVWARVLAAVPDSRLIIKGGNFGPGGESSRVLRHFSEMGVDPGRIVLMGKTSWSDHMLAFTQIDISLDSFPHSGGVTTLESLMMGVPMITLTWPTLVGRLSTSILTTLGLVDWVATTADEYVEIAVRKAKDRDALSKLRQSLRQMLGESAIGDVGTYVAAVEREYRQLWKEWCEAKA